MKMLLLVIVQVTFWLVAESAAIVWPASLRRCHIDDPKMNECLLHAARTLKPMIRDGIKELAIPSYNPLVLPYFYLSQESSLSDFNATSHKMTIRRIDDYNATEIRYDPESMTFSGKFEFPALSIDTTYWINGSIIAVPLRGKGPVDFTLGPVAATFNISGTIIKRINVEYYNISEVQIKLKITDTSIYFDGLFDGDPELGPRANELINLNSQLFTVAITPVFEEISHVYITRYLKWLTYKFPFYQLFPHS